MKDRKKRSKTASRSVWAQRFEDWKHSGLSQAAFCKQSQLKPSSFYNWSCIFRQSSAHRKAQSRSVVEKPTFIPVNLSSRPSELTLRCGDVTLHCADTVSADQLCQWIKALRQATCSQ